MEAYCVSCKENITDKTSSVRNTKQNDAAYADSKDLAKRTVSDKILKDRAYKIAVNAKHDGYERGLANMVHKFFGKRLGSGVNVDDTNQLIIQISD